MPDLLPLLWLAFSLLIGGLEIIAAVLFLRHRGAGPWLMLCGACVGLVIVISQQSLIFIGNARNLWGEAERIPLHKILTAIGLLSSVAHLVFAAGLLVTAFRLRGLSRRTADLEQIIGSAPPPLR